MVEHPLGKGEVHSSILCGSTSDLRRKNAAFKHEISDRPRVADLTCYFEPNRSTIVYAAPEFIWAMCESESMVSFQEQTMKPNQQANYDHTFRAIHDDEIPWQEGSKSVLKLPDGLQVKIFAHDKAMGRVDMKVKFPPGYVEPEHAHKSWHSIVVLKGRMCVAGKDLRPGDYVFGWNELHGPYEYPDGCEVFVVFMG